MIIYLSPDTIATCLEIACYVSTSCAAIGSFLFLGRPW